MKRDYSNNTDEDLMVVIQGGDARAFDTLYLRYNKRLLHYFYRMLGKDEEKAQDFLQDLFMKVAEKPHLFDTSKRFSTWLYSIASNMCKNEYRRLQVRVKGNQYIGDFNTTSEDVVLPHIERRLDNKEFKRLLFEAVNELDAVKRDTFLMRYQEHFSIREISQALECSEGTVKSRLFYITKKLAERLRVYKPSSI